MDNGLPGTRTRNQSDGVDNFLIEVAKKKSLPKPCLHFSLHTAFPMYTSKTTLLLYNATEAVEQSIDSTRTCMNISEQEFLSFFVISSRRISVSFSFLRSPNQSSMIGQIFDTKNIQIPHPTSISRNRRSFWEEQRKYFFFLRKELFQ